jgi:hypothetical protein
MIRCYWSFLCRLPFMYLTKLMWLHLFLSCFSSYALTDLNVTTASIWSLGWSFKRLLILISIPPVRCKFHIPFVAMTCVVRLPAFIFLVSLHAQNALADADAWTAARLPYLSTPVPNLITLTFYFCLSRSFLPTGRFGNVSCTFLWSLKLFHYSILQQPSLLFSVWCTRWYVLVNPRGPQTNFIFRCKTVWHIVSLNHGSTALSWRDPRKPASVADLLSVACMKLEWSIMPACRINCIGCLQVCRSEWNKSKYLLFPSLCTMSSCFVVVYLC